MPFLEGPIAFTGKLDMLSAYRMRGVDKIVLRRKGGPSREKIKTSPSFENTRRTMTEFGGCSRLGSYVRMAMHPIRQLSDYNFGSDINSIMRQVQLRDDEIGAWGRRKIILSEYARILEGFQTTKKAPSFDSIVRTPVYYTIDRANRSARVEIPELLRDINYFPQNNHAMFRLTITLGIVPDVRYDVPAKEYLPAKWYNQACYAKEVSTDWNPSLEGMGSTTLEIAMDALPPEDGWTLMLAIGIQYGAFRENRKIAEVKRFGAAKILALRGKDGASSGDGKDEVEFEDVVLEDVRMMENGPESVAYREPEVRYVYTTKAAETEKTVCAVYSYTISTSVEEDPPSPATAPKPTASKPKQLRKHVDFDRRPSLLSAVTTFTWPLESLKTPIVPGPPIDRYYRKPPSLREAGLASFGRPRTRSVYAGLETGTMLGPSIRPGRAKTRTRVLPFVRCAHGRFCLRQTLGAEKIPIQYLAFMTVP